VRWLKEASSSFVIFLKGAGELVAYFEHLQTQQRLTRLGVFSCNQDSPDVAATADFSFF
jgi:hypothetical protein